MKCPSATPEMAGSVAFGVATGAPDELRIRLFERPIACTEEVLASTAPLPPAQVLRFAAPCQEALCSHFDGTNCSLVQRIVKLLPEVTIDLPRCSIRRECRWFRQEGPESCRVCPQVISSNVNPSPLLVTIAAPPKIVPTDDFHQFKHKKNSRCAD
jgi:hypothetical protein